MKALRILRSTLYSTCHNNNNHTSTASTILRAFFSAQPQHEDPLTLSPHSQPSESDSVFDSSHYEIHEEEPKPSPKPKPKPTWDEKYRARADQLIFGDDGPKGKLRLKEEEDERRRRVLAKALLEAALDKDQDEEEEEGVGVVKEEDQKSLSVGIIGAPNAGKSALTNYMVGTKVAAVSRKTNTTTHEVVGVLTKGDTQICFFDTPGLMLNCGGFPYRDVKARVESAWSSVNLYEVLIVIFDVHRHLSRPDSRVIKLIKRMGARSIPNQKRVLCMNKIDLVEKKKDLLKVAEEFKDLPGYERHFMISGLKGSGVKDLDRYLMEQAVERPWDEDPFTMSEEVMKIISLEVVRERLLDHVHQEIPYDIEHRLIDWKELRDGSLRIEQHFITHKLSQRKILVGKNGSKIGEYQTSSNRLVFVSTNKQIQCERGIMSHGHSAPKLIKGTCISLLKSCKSMWQLKQIQTLIFSAGLQHDRDTLNKLMASCMDSSVQDFHYALRIFNHIQQPSLFIYNLMIKAFVKRGSFRSAISLFKQLREDDGMWPDNYTYPYVFKAIGCMGEVGEGEKVHAFVIKTGLEFDSYVCNSLMDMYAELGRVGGLKQLFGEMPERDSVSWNIMISGCVRCRRFHKAVEVFQRMQIESNQKPTEATVVSTLTACAALRNVEVGKEIHSYIARELDFTTIMGNALLDMYCKCGYVSVAREIFDGMTMKNVNCWTSMVTGYVNCGELDQARDLFEKSPTRDVVLWTAMINGYVQFNRFDEAIALFGEMQIRGVKPDKFIVVALLTGCAQLGALEHGRWIHDYVLEKRIMVDAVVGTALIEMYAKCGCVEKSLEVFNGLKEKDTASWTSIICGLAMNGKTSKALKLFEEMKTFGAKPDDVTFIAVLSACSHAGLVEEGRKLFHSMSSIYHIEPNLEHYGCFIDLLGRAGLLHEAEELVRKLPDQKNEIIVPLYGSLLSACRIYGNIDMGERLATTLAKVKSRDSSVHSLLASIYASADRWEDVNKVRSKMKDLGIRKLPGCSAIEVHGIGNRGGVGALSHFRTKIGLPTWDR